MSDTEKPLPTPSIGGQSSSSSTLNALMPKTLSPDGLKGIPDFNFITYWTLTEPMAKIIEQEFGIYYVVPIIQSSHESRNGNSGLARNHCNLFGIVATDTWKKNGGSIANLPTWEEIKGKRIEMKREFRKYTSWEYSFRDWAKLISGLNIYKKAYEFLKNKETVPDGIMEMAKVYATDSKYAHKLLAIYNEVKTA